MLRRQLRNGMREVQEGRTPSAPQRYGDQVVPTYNNATILTVPASDSDDKAVMQNFGLMVCKAAIASADLAPGQRQAAVEKQVRQMQASGAFHVGVEGAASSKDKENVNA
jgi:hypothetical protein